MRPTKDPGQQPLTSTPAQVQHLAAAAGQSNRNPDDFRPSASDACLFDDGQQHGSAGRNLERWSRPLCSGERTEQTETMERTEPTDWSRR